MGGMTFGLPTRSTRRHRRGITLVEAIIALVLVAGMITAALNTVAFTARSLRIRATMSKASMLAHRTMNEVFALAYQEPNATPQFGTEAGEPTRATWDDIDDYHMWTELSPTARDGAPIPGYTGWSVGVQVHKVSTIAPDVVSAFEVGLRRITVVVNAPSGESVILKALRSKHSGIDVKSSAEKTIIAGFAIKLSLRTDQDASVGQALLLNQIMDPDA
ncbi:MAG: hypothetical protein KDA25_02100 [Phycisphaerales bacterium]|nr:hypothetical protein [Phycisphaerales bacterium]